MDLFTALENLVPELQDSLSGVASLPELEAVRVDFLGRRGRLALVMAHLPKAPPADRPRLGQAANAAKNRLSALLEERRHDLEAAAEAAELARFDPGLPGRLPWRGSRHPCMLVLDEICAIFEGFGYDILSGREVELDYYNFEALNFPADHPARDMQDTLFVAPGTLLRTHTSPMQIHAMLARKPPLAIIAPGRVYRRDSDLTHSPMFHQIEGLLVDTQVSMADLRGTLAAFVRTVFGPATRVRFRPSFFPFTEPSAEADISCFLCGGSGHVADAWGASACRVCKGTGWVEILGCGMVDPAVFTSVGYDPELYTGFAFGMGVERIAMLKYGISDLRLFFENDVRFLAQFA